jgi:hypothetical protein
LGFICYFLLKFIENSTQNIPKLQVSLIAQTPATGKNNKKRVIQKESTAEAWIGITAVDSSE